jgi:hypothetical protein
MTLALVTNPRAETPAVPDETWIVFAAEAKSLSPENVTVAAPLSWNARRKVMRLDTEAYPTVVHTTLLTKEAPDPPMAIPVVVVTTVTTGSMSCTCEYVSAHSSQSAAPLGLAGSTPDEVCPDFTR